MREPDWESLADLQFILYNRIAGSLNEALSGIALSDMPEAQDKPPGFWKDRATTKIAGVLNLFTAWSYLIRFKMGESLPERAIRPFQANTLLAWLGAQLQLDPPPQTESNPQLHANQETLQEALLLLYSVAFTQGAGVRLELEVSRLGMWFRVKFSRTQPMPSTLDELLAGFGDHWRAQDTGFELATARDFVRLNGAELMLNSSSAHGEFMFFVRAAGAPKKKTPPPPARAQVPPPQTRPLSPETLERTLESTGLNLETGQLQAASAPEKDTASATTDAETPPTSVPAQADPTPIFVDMQTGGPPRTPAAAPSLAVLRPLPPTLSELQHQLAARDAAEKSDESGSESLPVEPDEASHGDVAHTEAAQKDAAQKDAADKSPARKSPSGTGRETVHVQGADTLRLEDASKGSTGVAPAPKSVIVPVKLPDPAPPVRLSVPPAATSNSAVTRQTRTLTPVTRDSPPAPIGDEDNSQVPPADAPPDTLDSSRKESS